MTDTRRVSVQERVRTVLARRFQPARECRGGFRPTGVQPSAQASYSAPPGSAQPGAGRVDARPCAMGSLAAGVEPDANCGVQQVSSPRTDLAQRLVREGAAALDMGRVEPPCPSQDVLRGAEGVLLSRRQSDAEGDSDTLPPSQTLDALLMQCAEHPVLQQHLLDSPTAPTHGEDGATDSAAEADSRATRSRASPIEGAGSAAGKMEAIELLREQARAWEAWKDSELATWSPFVSAAAQQRRSVSDTERVDTAAQSDSGRCSPSGSEFALQQRLAYLAARLGCMRRALLAWQSGHDAACQSHRLHLLRLSLRCWVSMIVVGLRKQANVTAAVQHNRKRMFRCGLAWWVAIVVQRFKVTTCTSVAAARRMQTHFAAWHEHVIESEMCDEQYRSNMLRLCLCKLSMHAAISIACHEFIWQRQLRTLSSSVLAWGNWVARHNQVVHDAQEAKEACLHELQTRHHMDEHARHVCATWRVRHALLQWHWCTWPLKLKAAHEWDARNSKARCLCAWYLIRIMSGKRVRVSPTSCHAVLQRAPVPVQQQLARGGLAMNAEIYSPGACSSVSRRTPNPARCAPTPPCLGAMGCLPHGSSVCAWQELLWELRMATVKFGGRHPSVRPLKSILRPLPVASGRSCAVGARVLRAFISLAALDKKNILDDENDDWR